MAQRDLNCCLFDGNPGIKKGERIKLRFTANGMACCVFPLAVNGSRKQGDEWVEDTQWPRLVFWGKNAETITEYASSKTKIWVRTRFQMNIWEKDGQKQYTPEFIVQEWGFCGGKSDSESTTNFPPHPADVQQEQAAAGGEQTPDDVPF